MPIATVTSKGQITIPAEIRAELNLKAGDRVYFVKGESGYVLFPKNGSVQRLKGIFGKPDRIVSLEEMKESVARGLAARLEVEEVETV
jgi:antitoxin PrlF